MNIACVHRKYCTHWVVYKTLLIILHVNPKLTLKKQIKFTLKKAADYKILKCFIQTINSDTCTAYQILI